MQPTCLLWRMNCVIRQKYPCTIQILKRMPSFLLLITFSRLVPHHHALSFSLSLFTTNIFKSLYIKASVSIHMLKKVKVWAEFDTKPLDIIVFGVHLVSNGNGEAEYRIDDMCLLILVGDLVKWGHLFISELKHKSCNHFVFVLIEREIFCPLIIIVWFLKQRICFLLF